MDITLVDYVFDLNKVFRKDRGHGAWPEAKEIPPSWVSNAKQAREAASDRTTGCTFQEARQLELGEMIVSNKDFGAFKYNDYNSCTLLDSQSALSNLFLQLGIHCDFLCCLIFQLNFDHEKAGQRFSDIVRLHPGWAVGLAVNIIVEVGEIPQKPLQEDLKSTLTQIYSKNMKYSFVQ